jgi:hypothetical protein
MTDAKRPLPTLRFVITVKKGVIYHLIPQTTPKGRVITDVWAVPGDQLMHTNDLIARCKAQGWKYEIQGDIGNQRRNR